MDYNISYAFQAQILNLTKNEPNAELKIAAASLPPTAFVRITAEETGGGIHETTVSPDKSQGSKEVTLERNPLKKYMKIGTNRSVNDLILR